MQQIFGGFPKTNMTENNNLWSHNAFEIFHQAMCGQFGVDVLEPIE